MRCEGSGKETPLPSCITLPASCTARHSPQHQVVPYALHVKTPTRLTEPGYTACASSLRTVVVHASAQPASVHTLSADETCCADQTDVTYSLTNPLPARATPLPHLLLLTNSRHTAMLSHMHYTCPKATLRWACRGASTVRFRSLQAAWGRQHTRASPPTQRHT